MTAELLLRALLPPLERFSRTYTELTVSALATVLLSGTASAELGDGEASLLLIVSSSSFFFYLLCQRSLGELFSKLCRHFSVLKQALLRQLVRLLFEPAGHFLKVVWVERELTSRVLHLLSDHLQLPVKLEIIFGVVDHYSLALDHGE